MESNEIMVSVCCLVYNHEKYLRQCLEGFMMQKTDFKFEVLIHDDASTDGSADIIREYEKKYSDIIKPIYQTENQYSKDIKVSWVYQFPRAQGKYIALCEGDDYWTDKYKLQKQFDALENNIEAVFCTCKVRCVEESGKLLSKTIPSSDNIPFIIKNKDWIEMVCSQNVPFHTSGFFFRKLITEKWCSNLPKFIKISPVGDRTLMMLAATEGNLIYIENEMSCYRLQSIGSYTMRSYIDTELKIYNSENNIKSFIAFDSFTDYQYTEIIQQVVLEYQAYIYECKNEFRYLLSSNYRAMWKQFNTKGRLYRILWIICPHIMKHYVKVKGKSGKK